MYSKKCAICKGQFETRYMQRKYCYACADKFKDSNSSYTHYHGIYNFVKYKKNPEYYRQYNNLALYRKNRIKVFEREGNKCQICEKIGKITHHIDGDKSNHKLKNLMLLCTQCHANVHNKELNNVKGE